MNHGPEFQALWSQLRTEVVALQARGYYGDGNDEETPPFRNWQSESFVFLGMWSSGTRLADSAVIAGHEAVDDDLPEYMVMVSSRLRAFACSPSHQSVVERRAALVLLPEDDASGQSLAPP